MAVHKVCVCPRVLNGFVCARARVHVQADPDAAGQAPLPGSRSAPGSAGPTRRRLHHGGPGDDAVDAMSVVGEDAGSASGGEDGASSGPFYSTSDLHSL